MDQQQWNNTNLGKGHWDEEEISNFRHIADDIKQIKLEMATLTRELTRVRCVGKEVKEDSSIAGTFINGLTPFNRETGSCSDSRKRDINKKEEKSPDVIDEDRFKPENLALGQLLLLVKT